MVSSSDHPEEPFQCPEGLSREGLFWIDFNLRLGPNLHIKLNMSFAQAGVALHLSKTEGLRWPFIWALSRGDGEATSLTP